jgi:hypothetical protein
MLRRTLFCLLACLGLVAAIPAAGAQAAAPGRIYTCAGNNDATLVNLANVGVVRMGGNSGYGCLGEGTGNWTYWEPTSVYIDPGTCGQMRINDGPLGPLQRGGGWHNIYPTSGLTGTWKTTIYHWVC